MTPLLDCKDITVRFGTNTVLDRLSFPVERGDYLSVIGKNGSGKSTLIRCLLRLCPVTSGSITPAEDFSRRDIGYLPQQSGIQKDFPATVEEVVRSGCLGHHKILPFYTRADKLEAEKNMHRLGICQLRRRSFRTLSGGQQQRVLLARALCATKQLLLLDEPVTGLDPEVSAELYSIIHELNEQDHGLPRHGGRAAGCKACAVSGRDGAVLRTDRGIPQFRLCTASAHRCASEGGL